MNYIILSVTSLIFIFLFWPLFPQLVRDWLANPDYSHGFLILPLSLYFLWRKRKELIDTPVVPSVFGIFIILAGLILYIFGKMGFQLFLQYISMLVVLFGLVYAQAGRPMAKAAAFPIAYLIFMFPLPQLVYTTVTFHLSILSTKASYLALRLFGINAMREGNIIDLPTCRLVVATPCSGLRSLIVFMAASLAIGFVFQKGIRERVILFIISIPLAVFINTLRLFVTAFIINMLRLTDVPIGIHDRAGDAAAIAGFLILFWLSDFMAKKKK